MAHRRSEARAAIHRALIGCALFTLAGCSGRYDLKKAAGPDGRVPVLVVVEPSTLPRFVAHHEVGPGDVIREARVLSRAPLGSTLAKVVPPPPLEELAETSVLLARHLSGAWSKQRTLRPPSSTTCLLQGAAPEVPAECASLPLALRVQVRVVRFDAMPGELRLRTFVADASLEDRAGAEKRGRTVWSSRCELQPVEVPEVPGAHTAAEVNQILERAAQVCSEKLERSLRRHLAR